MPATRVRTSSETRDRFFGTVLLLAVIGALTLWFMAWIDAGFARGASKEHFMASIVASAVIVFALMAVVAVAIRRIGGAPSRRAEPSIANDEDAR